MSRRLIFAALALLCAGAVSAQKRTETPAASSEVRYVGRTQTKGGDVSFDWSGTSFECRFTGGSLAMRVSDTKKNYYNLTVDGRDAGVVTTFGTDSVVVLAEKLGRRRTYRADAEAHRGRAGAYDDPCLPARPGEDVCASIAAPGRHIEFIGNSLTCGYGTEGLSKDEPFKPQTENCNKAYACIIARYFGADYTLIAHSGRGAARNYGDKNTTSQNTMADRIANTFDEAAEPAWDFAASPYRPDLVVINLGSNDFSTLPHPSRDEFAAAYTRILQTLRGAYGDEMPILCVAPRVSEPAFTYIRDLCQSAVVPNLHFAAVLPGYCNDGSELGSSAHPNYAGQRKMAMLLIPYVSTLTGWEAEIKPVE